MWAVNPSGGATGRRLLRNTLLTAVLLVALRPPALAHQGAPPGREVVDLLPDARAFGDGWVRQGDPTSFLPSDAFRDGALVAYGGPTGARVVLAVLLVTDDRVAVRAAWEGALKTYDRYRTDLSYDDGYAEELATLPPPAGCAEAKRIEGTSESDTFLTGVTLCAVDPDVILLVVASGRVADLAGYRASDAVVGLVLGSPPVGIGTPASSA